MKPPAPKNEKKRLEIVWQYDVLDTKPEKAFDDLTELAATICEAPIALITLVDEKRQWFKSKLGVDAGETSRDVSFCAHAIIGKKVFVVPDATQDKRFAKNPLVTGEPGIRFYAGAPLVSPEGQALGTLCVIDKVPRQLRPRQKRALEILSHHVMAQLELRRRSRELARAREEQENLMTDLREVRAELERTRRQLRRASSTIKARTRPSQKHRR